MRLSSSLTLRINATSGYELAVQVQLRVAIIAMDLHDKVEQRLVNMLRTIESVINAAI